MLPNALDIRARGRVAPYHTTTPKVQHILAREVGGDLVGAQLRGRRRVVAIRGALRDAVLIVGRLR